jgi:uncharacterized protein (TIGR00299 family) protein
MAKSTLYLDCASGISGDMFVAAMLDLGADEKKVRRALAGIPGGHFEIRISRTSKSGIDCCDFDVVLDAAHETHDHDMNYLFGHPEDEGTGDHHMAEHHADHHFAGDHHADNHHTDDDHHSHVHRTLADVLEILDGCEMTERARALAGRIFRILADAEAKAHGTTAQAVRFHEVGAIDSIADIAAAAVCFDDLDIGKVYSTPLYEGSGTIRCAHGFLPVPVPAVANVIAESTLKLKIDPDTRGEFVTPTGAAIAAAIVTESSKPGALSVKKIGLGAGKRSYSRPNFLRAMLIEEEKESVWQNGGHDSTPESVWMLESDIDDTEGEAFGYLLGRLMDAGALDAHFLPVYMKKNRPAYQLQVICTETLREELEQIIFRETTTIGIRRVRMDRTVLPRTAREVETPYGTARVKITESCGKKRIDPEYESVCELCAKTGRSFAECRTIILNSVK